MKVMILKEKYLGAEILAKCLRDEGVKYVFGLVGHGNLPFIDAIDKEGIQFISCHHETIAAMAADGYYRASHRPGVLCTTCTPGALNAQLGIATAAADHSAIVHITGDIPLQFAGKGTYEELDINGPDWQFHSLFLMFKHAWKVSNIKLLPEILANAFNVALSGCPGPVLIDIPFDLATKEVETGLIEMKKRRPGKPSGDPNLVERAADLLLTAKSPVIFVGGGVSLSEAADEVLQLAELLGAPIVTSIMGSCAIPGKHPLMMGLVGTYGIEGANKFARQADVILAVGARFEEEETAIWTDNVFRIPPTKLIQIDIDPKIIGKNYPIEIGIVGDAKNTLINLIRIIKGRIHGSQALNKDRIEEVHKEKEKHFKKIEHLIISTDRPVSARRLLKELEDRFPENGILVVDPSWPRIGLIQQFFLPGPTRCYIVGGVLPIGWSTAASIGIQLARPDSKVIAISGDGGFLLNNQAVLTAVEYDLPILWIIINNGAYYALEVLQKAYFGKSIGSRFIRQKTGQPLDINYAELAKVFKADGERIQDPEEIGPAIERGIRAVKPYIIDCVVNPETSRLVRVGPVTWEFFWEEMREVRKR
ncbi:MAG: thiamine pyrophosphate-binding protein [Candidatus Bathyarchaeia archaeon]|nr:thiamine pyrophosphate-binding protein [Candidatus Bathyarchaeota archaeon]